jgi:membrane-associated phospholipid phosphatase
VDIRLAIYFKETSPDFVAFAKLATDIIDPWPQIFLWPLLYFLATFFWKRKKLGNRFLLLALSIPLSNGIVEILKRILGRTRPEALWSLNFYGFDFFGINNLEYSFPSGHACTAGVLVGALACFYPQRSFPLLLIGALLAFTRVILGYHFLSDVIAGMSIGLLAAQWIYRTMKLDNTSF